MTAEVQRLRVRVWLEDGTHRSGAIQAEGPDAEPKLWIGGMDYRRGDLIADNQIIQVRLINKTAGDPNELLGRWDISVKKKTSLELPEELWIRAKRRALDERTDFRSLVIQGLEVRLAQKPKKREKP